MASVKEIRIKIKSVKATQQITKAMKMVAAARMRKAQMAILNSRPFAVQMDKVVEDLVKLEVLAEREAGREVSIHPYFEDRGDAKECLILVTADKGLCGSFNANILRAAIAWIQARQGKKLMVAIVGRKGRDLINRLRDVQLDRLVELVNVFPKIGFKHAELLAEPVLAGFEKGEIDRVTVIYTEFKSAVSQVLIQKQLLPIPIPELKEGESINSFGFHFEPSREDLLSVLLPRDIKAQLFRFLLESQAAELAARMNAMDSASKNAGELLDGLTLAMNRLRQGIITNELMEIVGGAEALEA
ncbi:MAG: ATP synthase F1 subunit gamma [Elusimicrobia bacterium]|nr:MAG: ATP synthase F1 subunit gamma [Elusimicrobiota bacterium]